MRISGRSATWAAAGLAVTGLAAVLASVTRSPRIPVSLIRFGFERAGTAVAAKMLPHVPADVASRLDIDYRPGDRDAVLDVHRPDGAAAALPVLVWVHGGGWVSGRNSHVNPYLRILAARGNLVTVAVDYTRGPAGFYPTALGQISDALDYLTDHAVEFGIDPQRIVLAGDSAGAQLVSELAAILTNPQLEARAGVTPRIPADRLRGMVLHCGVYDLTAFVHAPRAIAWGFGQIMWAYTGRRSVVGNAAIGQMSTIGAVSREFPPTFIAAGNGDPLTSNQSVPFAARLIELGVPVQTCFYPDDHLPVLSHEFQFNLDGADGQLVLDRTVDFLRARFS